MLLDEEERESAKTFYSPLCKSKPYLTPEQRRKLREKRKIDLSPVSHNNEDSVKPLKKVRRLFAQKPKAKLISKKTIHKKIAKVSLPEVCCTAAQWVPQSKTTSENKKFFKTRSPEHLKKAKFVLEYKRSRIDFGETKLSVAHDIAQDPSSPKSAQSIISKIHKNDLNMQPMCNATLDVKSRLNGTVKVTENPHIVRVASIPSESSHLPVNKTANCLVLESISEDVPSDRKTVSGEQVPNSVSKDALCDGKTAEVLEASSDTPKTDIFELDLVADCSSLNILEEKLPSSKPKNYPIFDKESIKKIKWDVSPPEKPFNGSFRTKDKSKGYEQMIIDAGQNKIGANLCKTCGMIYTIGHEEDEKLHSENHDMYLQLKFPGWKDERVIGSYDDGRVIKILKDDKNFRLKKVQDILLIVNRELGFPSAAFNGYLQGQNVMVILFISKDKFVKGCLVAESISSASPVVLDKRGTSRSYYASSETVRAICGINRIWVSREYRKQKIASRMVDCLRSNFILGLVVSLEELAFTDPTEDGMQFAASYTGTENFLVYK